MATTRKSGLFDNNHEPAMCTPDRSRGPLGILDAADPTLNLSVAGDTAGPVGTNSDGGEMCIPETVELGLMTMKVLEVDLEQIDRFLYSVAYAIELDEQTTLKRDRTRTRMYGEYVETERVEGIELPDNAMLKMKAQGRKSTLLSQFQPRLEEGPQAVLDFLTSQQSIKDKSKRALQEKFNQAQRAGSQRVEALGLAIKVLALVEFGSTCFIKIASAVTGTGSVVDIAYDTAQAGVDAHFEKEPVAVVVKPETSVNRSGNSSGPTLQAAPSRRPKQTTKDGVGSAMAGKALEETSKEALESASQALFGKVLKPEYKEMADVWKNYSGDLDKLTKRADKVSEKIYVEVFKKGSKSKAKYRRRLYRKQAKLQSKIAQKRVSPVKTVGSKGLTIVFLANDLREAWGRLAKNWEDSN